jgi:hypothetical protein
LLAAAFRRAYRFLMVEKQDRKTGSAAGEKRVKDARAERLAAALRANLKRRKQQARVRATAKAGEN